MTTFDNTKLKQLFFLLIIFGMGTLLALKLVTYLSSFLGALTLYVLFRKFQHKLVHEHNVPSWLSAISIMLIATVVLLVPFIWVAQIAVGRIAEIVLNPQVFIKQAENAIIGLKELTGFDFFSPNTIAQIQSVIASQLPSLVGGTFMAVANILLMYFILYFFLTNGKSMEKFAGNHLPLKEDNTLLLGRRMKELIISNSIVIPLLGAVQAIFSMLGYWIFGEDEFIIYGIITGVTSVIPVIGTMIVWIPLGLVQIAEGNISNGVSILIYGFVVIANVDNLFRFILQKKIADVHPLITIFGVILGVQLFGFVGIIFGPILISVFILMLELYRKEFLGKSKLSKENQPEQPEHNLPL